MKDREHNALTRTMEQPTDISSKVALSSHSQGGGISKKNRELIKHSDITSKYSGEEIFLKKLGKK